MRRRLGVSFPFACLPIEPVPSGRWPLISLRPPGAVMTHIHSDTAPSTHRGTQMYHQRARSPTLVWRV